VRKDWILPSIGLAIVLILSGCAAPTVRSSAHASPRSSASTDGISRNEAVDLARDALRGAGQDWDIVLAEAGPLGQVSPGWAELDWGRGLSADRQVWRVVTVAGELSAEVVIDFVDGSVYSSTMGIAN
jgi:hypothetical protein